MEEVSPKPIDTNTLQKHPTKGMDIPLKYFIQNKEKYRRYLTKKNDNKQGLFEKNSGGDTLKSTFNNRGNLLINSGSYMLNTHQAVKSSINEKLKAINTTDKFIMSTRNQQLDRRQERPYVPSMQHNIVSGINYKLSSKNPKNLLALNKLVKKSTANSIIATKPLSQRSGYQPNSTLKSLNIRKEYLLNPNTHTLSHLISKEKYEHLKVKAQDAISEGKIFCVSTNTNGSSAVRRALIKRGWIERFSTSDDKGNLHERLVRAPDAEALILSNFLKSRPVKFLWTDNSLNWSLIHPSTIVNKFPSTGISLWTKTGLLKFLQTQQWTNENGKSQVKFPRTFSIYNLDDLNYFCSEYRLTACVNMLKKFYYAILEDQGNTITDDGMVDIRSIDFAVERLCEYLGTFEHAYIDFWNLSVVSEVDWDNFLSDYYNFAHNGKKIRNTEKFELDKLITSIKACLDKIKIHWPEVQFEGTENLWLIKPSAQSCGRGIVIMKTLTEVRNHCLKRQPVIVQKYIERPLLIYNTKFDIRQWFLVTNTFPLKIYMYGKCYLRFCSKEYSLQNLHESVHLSNNSIQWRYEHIKKHNCKLPKQNMWDSDQFQEYLKNRGDLDKWNRVIVPGIRRSIIGAMLACQEGMSDRRNSFNLYGADFLLTEEFTPLLIEINSCPCMRNTTDVTARLCPMVLDDTVQVMTSGKPPTNTGHYQLIYDQFMGPEIPTRVFAEGNRDMMVSGSRAHLHTIPARLKELYAEPRLFQNYKKRNHWEDRSLKYDNLCWYKSKKPCLWIIASIDPKFGCAIPKYPGEPTPQEHILYVTKTIGRPEITKWMDTYKDRISRHLAKQDPQADHKKESIKTEVHVLTPT